MKQRCPYPKDATEVMQKSASMLALFCFTSLRKQAEQAVQFTLHVPQNQRFDEAKVQERA